MKLLGLGSPDKVPALNEKQAIELGAELMSEFFVFGTAVAAILLEYLRQAKKTENKSNQMSNDIESLNARNEQVLKDIEKNLKLMSDLKKGIDEQKSELKTLNGRIHVIEDKFKLNLNEISSQTSDEKPIGKIMYPSNSAIKANADVRNSIIYQAADDAIISLIQKSID
jgi:TolA-binding protein